MEEAHHDHEERADRARCRRADGRGRRGRGPDRGARAHHPDGTGRAIDAPQRRGRYLGDRGGRSRPHDSGHEAGRRPRNGRRRRVGPRRDRDRGARRPGDRRDRLPAAPAFPPGVAGRPVRRRPAGTVGSGGPRGGGLPGDDAPGRRRHHRVVRGRGDRRRRGRGNPRPDGQRRRAARVAGEAGCSRGVLRRPGAHRRAQRRRPGGQDGQRPHRYRASPGAPAGSEVPSAARWRSTGWSPGASRWRRSRDR